MEATECRRYVINHFLYYQWVVCRIHVCFKSHQSVSRMPVYKNANNNFGPSTSNIFGPNTGNPFITSDHTFLLRSQVISRKWGKLRLQRCCYADLSSISYPITCDWRRYRARLNCLPGLVKLLLITTAWTCIQHSLNLGMAF